MQNSSYNFEDFEISDASVSIPKLGAERPNNNTSSTPYPTRKSNNFNLGSPITSYGLGKFTKENNAAYDSKLNGVDFAISESDNNKFLSGRGNNNNNDRLNNILSPQVTSSEMKRHFNDFSSAFPLNNYNNLDGNNNNNNNNNNHINNNFDDDFLFDQSIEVGRSNKNNFYSDNKLFSLSSSSPRKVPGSSHQANSPLPFEKRYPFYRRPENNHEKVTSSSSSPKEPKITSKNFKIPQGYGDDASFFESLGLKNPLTKGADFEKKKSGVKSTVDPISLPDISGLSSIFSSEESARNKGQKKGNVQHKTLQTVPIDFNEKALFSALSDFKSSVAKLEEEKRKAYSELESLRSDQQLLKDDYKKLRQELVNARQQIEYDSRVNTQLEQKARKYKTMAASLKDYTKSLEDSTKNGTPQDIFELRQRFDNMNNKYMALNEENDNIVRMLSERDYDLSQRRYEIRNLQAEVSRLKTELATTGFKPNNKYSGENNESYFNRPDSSSHRQYGPSRRPVSRNPSGYNYVQPTTSGNGPNYQPYNTNPPVEATKPNVQFLNPLFGAQQQQQQQPFNAQQDGNNGQFNNQAAVDGQYPNNNAVHNGPVNNTAFNGTGQYNTTQQQQTGISNQLGNNPPVNQSAAQPGVNNQFGNHTVNGQFVNNQNGSNPFNNSSGQPGNNPFISQQHVNNQFPASAGQTNPLFGQSQPLNTGSDQPYNGSTNSNGNLNGTNNNNLFVPGTQPPSQHLFGGQIPPNNAVNAASNTQHQAFASAPPTQPFDHVQPFANHASRPSVQEPKSDNLTNLASQLLDLLSAKINEKAGSNGTDGIPASEITNEPSKEPKISNPELNAAVGSASSKTHYKDEIEIIRKKLEELIKLQKDKVLDVPVSTAIPLKKKKHQPPRQVIIEDAVDVEWNTSSEEEVIVNSSDEEDETDADKVKIATKNKKSKSVTRKTKPFRILDRLKSFETAKRECKACQLENATPHHLHTQMPRPRSFPTDGASRKNDDDIESWVEEATPRPTADPEESVRMIIERMSDEFNTLKTSYYDLNHDYDGRNPALERTKRHKIAYSLKKLVDEMESKADQIYAMYDVMAATNIDLPEGIAVAGHPAKAAAVANDGELMGQYSWIS